MVGGLLGFIAKKLKLKEKPKKAKFWRKVS
jgi:hypothetical protein